MLGTKASAPVVGAVTPLEVTVFVPLQERCPGSMKPKAPLCEESSATSVGSTRNSKLPKVSVVYGCSVLCSGFDAYWGKLPWEPEGTPSSS